MKTTSILLYNSLDHPVEGEVNYDYIQADDWKLVITRVCVLLDLDEFFPHLYEDVRNAIEQNENPDTGTHSFCGVVIPCEILIEVKSKAKAA